MAMVGVFLAGSVEADVIEKATKIAFREKLSLPGGSASRCDCAVGLTTYSAVWLTHTVYETRRASPKRWLNM